MLLYQRIGIFLMLLGLVLAVSGALFKGRFSSYLMTAGFVLACLSVLWMVGLLVYSTTMPIGIE